MHAKLLPTSDIQLHQICEFGESFVHEPATHLSLPVSLFPFLPTASALTFFGSVTFQRTQPLRQEGQSKFEGNRETTRRPGILVGGRLSLSLENLNALREMLPNRMAYRFQTVFRRDSSLDLSAVADGSTTFIHRHEALALIISRSPSLEPWLITSFF